MSWELVEGHWTEVRGHAKKHWDKLTDGDLDGVAGKREALADRIRARYGIEKDAADREIEAWMKEPGVLDDWNDMRPILDM